MLADAALVKGLLYQVNELAAVCGG